MFNPVFNQDGHISYFRITCLAIAVGCFISGCVMQSEDKYKQESENSLASANAQTELTASDKVTQDSSLSVESIRHLALVELKDATEYMQACGAIDNAYDNCSFEFSNEFKQYYQTSLDASADGFDLKISALENNQDQCKIFEFDSNGDLKAFNAQGIIDQECLSGLDKELKKFSIIRDTDYTQGQIAPSGISPIIHNLTLR